MEISWEPHGTIRDNYAETIGKPWSMWENIWESHGKTMRNPMGKPVGIVENYEETMGTSWSMWEQLLGNHLEIAANIFGNHREIVGKHWET